VSAQRFDLEAHKRRKRAQRPWLWWGQQSLGIDKLTAARQRAEFAFDHYDLVSVQFSGGKDSTCVLQVALEVARERGALPLNVQFLDEEGISYETEEYVRRIAGSPEIELEWFCLPVTHRNACSAESPWWYPWAPEARELWVREPPPEGTFAVDGYEDPGPHGVGERNRPTWPELANWMYGRRAGRVGCLMGIRADESLLRRKAVSVARRENFVIPTTSKVDKVYPIYDWTTEDVWTATKLGGWDHNTTYDLMEMAGVPPNDQRCAPPFGDEPSKGLYMWAECFPEIWERLCRRVPGAATAARYARTELYGHKDFPERPAGLPWPDFIRSVIARHTDENDRVLVAREVQWNIDHHYRATSDPILEVTHPASGCSWPFLLKIAMSGDLKDRRKGSIPHVKTQEHADRYFAALDEYRASLK
jgi:predicted phosphoadenosine phosphosulfate sulfurtransferase